MKCINPLFNHRMSADWFWKFLLCFSSSNLPQKQIQLYTVSSQSVNSSKWALQESNLAPLSYQESALPLSHAPNYAMNFDMSKFLCHQESVLPLNQAPLCTKFHMSRLNINFAGHQESALPLPRLK